MAERGQAGEEQTCAICVESVRDPVQLPCQHSYCSGCITMFAEKSKPKDTREPSSDALGDDWLIVCPMCRQPTKLWSEGMAALNVNSTSEETIEKGKAEVRVGSEVKVEQIGLWCSFCEEDYGKQAVKFCVECDTFYCEDCLSLHPMRGKFKHHQLISAPKYIHQWHTESSEKTEEEDLELCTAHKKALVLYCDACQQLCCLDCMQHHCGHPMSDKPSAYRKLRESFYNKTEDCRGLKEELTGFFSKVEQFLNDVKENEAGKKREIENAYKKGLDVLSAWRRDALGLVEKEHSALSSQAETTLLDISGKLTEIERMIQDAGDLATSLSEIFLKMSRELSLRIDEQLPKAREYVKHEQGTMEKLEKCLKQNPVSSLYLNVDLRTVSVPRMQFAQTSDESLRTEDDGSTVHIENGPRKWCEAWTGCSFQTGRHFWQIQISLAPANQLKTLSLCTFGVRQEDHSLNGRNGKECWWVCIKNSKDGARFVSNKFNVNELYNKFVRLNKTYTLGFYLDCYSQRLTVIDCGENAVILTMDNLDMSKPLVPAVDFHGSSIQAASARLVTCDSMSPPSVLWSTL